MIADMIYDIDLGISKEPIIIDPNDPTKRKYVDSDTYTHEDLLVPIFKDGKLVYQSPDLKDIRQFAINQLDKISSASKRFANPQIYIAGVEHRLYENRLRLILEQRKLIS
jgi:nicotinate phosphoribosyltransferase